MYPYEASCLPCQNLQDVFQSTVILSYFEVFRMKVQLGDEYASFKILPHSESRSYPTYLSCRGVLIKGCTYLTDLEIQNFSDYEVKAI